MAPKFSTLVEDFATGIDSKWEPEGEVIAWVDGKVVVSNGSLDGISTTSDYDLHESSVSLQLSNVEGFALIQLSGVTTDVVPAFLLATDEGELTIGAGDFAEILTTDPTEPTLSERREWFRFRETGGTLHWETSADGRTWDVLGTAEHSENFSRLRLSVGVLFGGSFTFDNVNITPPPAEWGKFFAFF